MNELSPLSKRFFEKGMVEDCPIYDMHGHMGPIYGLHIPAHDAHSMIRMMDRAGVRMLVFSHHSALFAPDLGNTPSIEAVNAYPERLRAYCALNPNYPDALQRDVDTFEEQNGVYVGFKLLADYHGYAITHERYQPAWELADHRGLIMLTHTWGGSTVSGYGPLCEVAERYPNAKILIGHSLHGEWNSAMDIVKRFSNTYLDLCAVMDDRGVLEGFVDGIGSERILFGTDLPWFDEHYYIGAILGTSITDEDRRNIFYRNAQKLLDGLI